MREHNGVFDSQTAARQSSEEAQTSWPRPGYPLTAAAEAISSDLQWTPELHLMLAILEDAIACYLKTLKRPRQNPEILARQAEYWIRLEDWDSPFSFNNICEALGMDPAALRDRVLRQATNDHSESKTPQVCKKPG